MSMSLSFSPEFFLAEGEPYDRSDLALNRKGKPVSVWSAICLMKENNPDDWKSMAHEVFGLSEEDSELLMAEAVLDKIQETNTCDDCRSPVRVYIDDKGDYSVEVWD